jgi:TonB family protein
VDSLRAALDAHDRSLGLGTGGPLVEPTREAVSASLVPGFARAVLEFTTDRAGLVVSVRVLDSSSDRQAWDEVAEKLAQGTRKRPLRMPPGARGIAVTMQVESTIRNASGQDPGQSVLSRVAGGLFEPSELLMDSNAKPRRVVVAKVISETRL